MHQPGDHAEARDRESVSGFWFEGVLSESPSEPTTLIQGTWYPWHQATPLRNIPSLLAMGLSSSGGISFADDRIRPSATLALHKHSRWQCGLPTWLWLGFRVYRVQGKGFRVQGSVFRV